MKKLQFIIAVLFLCQATLVNAWLDVGEPRVVFTLNNTHATNDGQTVQIPFTIQGEVFDPGSGVDWVKVRWCAANASGSNSTAWADLATTSLYRVETKNNLFTIDIGDTNTFTNSGHYLVGVWAKDVVGNYSSLVATTNMNGEGVGTDWDDGQVIEVYTTNNYRCGKVGVR